MVQARPILVIVGAASRDVDIADPRGWRLGGTVTYGALAAARLGVEVRALIGVDAESEPAHEFEVLRQAGVEVRLARLEHAPVFDNRQTAAGRVQHAVAVSDLLQVTQLPDDWRRPDSALLGPIAAELDQSWAHAFHAETAVAFAAQGALRRLAPDSAVERLPIERSPLWERADRILISAEDLVPGAPPLQTLLRPGQKLVVTHGDRGALYIERRETAIVARYLPPTPRRRPVDTTGAGDTFLAAWAAAATLMPAAGEWRALLVASVMASLSVERATLSETPTISEICEVLVRLRDPHLG